MGNAKSMQPLYLCNTVFRKRDSGGSKRVATGKVKRVGEFQQMGSKANALPHTMEKHQRSGLRWTTNIIPHLVQECQPQHGALW